MHLFSGNQRKVMVPIVDVRGFMLQWPCSGLSPNRHYWFEFDDDGDLVDCDVPEHSDGAASAAMAEDCRDFFLHSALPSWASATE